MANLSYARCHRSMVVGSLLYKQLQRQRTNIITCCSRNRFYQLKRSIGVMTTTSDENSNSSSTSPQDGGVLRLLTNEQRVLLKEQRELMRRAANVAEDLQLPSSSPSSGGVVQQLESSMFSIVVAGEFNGGKSTFINALLGKPLLEMGPLPTTDCITIVTGGGSVTSHNDATVASKEVQPQQGIVIHRVVDASDVNFLNDDLILVDTPGSNTLSDGHEFRTKRWLPHADLILFVISADRPLSESERSFLQSMERYRKQIIVIINKMDLLESLGGNYGQAAKQRVVEYVTENTSSLLGRRPLVFPISARNALECKLSSSSIVKSSSVRSSAIYSESPTWKRSGFEPLQKFLVEELTNEAKVTTKLCNPIRVAESVARDALEALDIRVKALDSDRATLSLLEEQMNAWEALMISDMMNDWNRVKQQFIKDSNKLYDSLLNDRTSYVTQIILYLSRERFLRHCAKCISNKNDMISKVDSIVRESSDSFAVKVRSQSQAVLEYLGKRPISCSNKMVGTMAGNVPTFEQIQKSFYDKIMNSINEELLQYEPEKDMEKLFQSLQRITIATCAIEGTATIVFFDFASALVSSSPVNMFSTFTANSNMVGIMTSATFLTMIASIIIYPLKIKEVWRQYRQSSVDRFEKTMSLKLFNISKEELTKLNQKIVEGILPYKIFCKAENDRNQRLRTESEEILAIGHNLRRRIEKRQ